MVNYKKNTTKYLVFVDFDGVLTSARQHFAQPKDAYGMWATFDPVAVEFLNKIHNTFDGVRFVWTTTWRNNMPDTAMTTHWAYSMWYNAGFRGLFADVWRVNPEDQKDGNLNHADRASEIKHYLDTYEPDALDYLILDDTDYGFNKTLPKNRFVKTSSMDGILNKHMKDTWSIVGMWDRKDEM